MIYGNTKPQLIVNLNARLLICKVTYGNLALVTLHNQTQLIVNLNARLLMQKVNLI